MGAVAINYLSAIETLIPKIPLVLSFSRPGKCQ